MRILYATDGSEGSLAAAGLLAALPLDTDSTVTILTVQPESREGDSDAHRAAAQEVLTVAADALGHATAGLERHVRWGHPVEQILRAAEERATDLIVMGTHGHSGLARLLLGSVAERVAHLALCPVLLVRGRPTGIRRIVLGVETSEGGERAAEWLCRFPLPAGCEVRLVTVLPNLHELARERMLITPPLSERPIPLYEWQREQASLHLARTASAFGAVGKTAVTEIRSGDIAPGLLEVADDEGAELIVVGSHGASTGANAPLGSVAHHVVSHSRCSVLVVRGPFAAQTADAGGSSPSEERNVHAGSSVSRTR